MAAENKAKTPYNFIPFPEKVIYRYENITELPKHDRRLDTLKFYETENQEKSKIQEKYNTGYIEYTVNTVTPLFISDGNGDFFKINNEYMIPGSTMRGRIRSNLEIISNSYPEYIENQKFWYRGLADKSNKLRNEYDNYLRDLKSNKENNIEDSVAAGYLIKIGNKYKIIPAKKDRFNHSFVRIKESKLRNLSFGQENNEKCFMYKDIDWQQIQKLKKQKNTTTINRKLKNDKEKNKNHNYAFKSYQKEVYYKLDERGNIKDISTNNKNGYSNGYLVNSSNLGNKQVHYLIFQEDKDSIEVKISRDVKDNFETNIRYIDNVDKYLFDLDFNDESKKAIFYKVNLKNGRSADVIGFTPYLKIPYKNGIADNLQIDYDSTKIDYTKAIFGMTDPIAYKGRVMFDNAIIENNNANKIGKIKKALLGPKATSFQLYLKQPIKDVDRLKNYNDDDFQLRGYKFYYLKEMADLRSEDSSGNYLTTIDAIENSKFHGKIHFENLSRDELGLLIMSIKPFEDGFEMLGQGKPFGFGQVTIDIDRVVTEDLKDLNDYFFEESGEKYFKSKSLKMIDLVTKGLNEENPQEFVDEFVDEFNQRATKQLEKPYKLFELDNELMNAFRFSKTRKMSLEQSEYMNIKYKPNGFTERWILDEIFEMENK